jgi:hypothetical protein
VIYTPLFMHPRMHPMLEYTMTHLTHHLPQPARTPCTITRYHYVYRWHARLVRGFGPTKSASPTRLRALLMLWQKPRRHQSGRCV